MKPKSQLIIGYQEFFNSNLPGDRLSLIEGISKDHLIMEIACLNFMIKPNRTLYQDTSLETQTKILRHFFQYDKGLILKYGRNFSRFIRSKEEYGLLLTRSTCLFALEEILQSNLPVIEGFLFSESWEKLFSYLLAVNSAITEYGTIPEHSKNERLVSDSIAEDAPLEIVNAKLIALNELALETDPIYTPYRGYHLCIYLIEKTELGQHLIDYFKNEYGVQWDQFFYEVLGLYIGNNAHGENNVTHPITGEVIDTTFHFNIKKRDESFFNAFAKVYPSTKIQNLISIKKFPLFHYHDDKYVLLDNQLLIDKGYNQLINDFWFDVVKQIKNNKGGNAYTIERYRSLIGMFFESYLKMLFNDLIGGIKFSVLKQFEDLKVKSGKNEVELADIYFRKGKRVFLAQAKTTGVGSPFIVQIKSRIFSCFNQSYWAECSEGVAEAERSPIAL